MSVSIERVSEGLVVVKGMACTPAAYAEWARSSFGTLLDDVVPARFSVGLYFKDASELPELSPPELSESQSPGRRFSVPVCYEMGPDLEEAANLLRLTSEELITLHCKNEVECFAVGFCPGFGYCAGIDDRLKGLARRPSPRKRVLPGSVGLTGEMTAIYPLERPGGWQLIGRTPLVISDPQSGFYPLQPGDKIRFVRIGEKEFAGLQGRRIAAED